MTALKVGSLFSGYGGSCVSGLAIIGSMRGVAPRAGSAHHLPGRRWCPMSQTLTIGSLFSGY